MAKTGEPYSYASGNPTTLSDPLGLCSSPMVAAVPCPGPTGKYGGGTAAGSDGPGSNGRTTKTTHGPPAPDPKKVKKVAEQDARPGIHVRLDKGTAQLLHEPVGLSCQRYNSCDYYSITIDSYTGKRSTPKMWTGWDRFDNWFPSAVTGFASAVAPTKAAITVWGGTLLHLLEQPERPKFNVSFEVQATLRVWTDGKVQERSITTWVDVSYSKDDVVEVMPDGNVTMRSPEVGYTEVGIESSPPYNVGDPVWKNPGAR